MVSRNTENWLLLLESKAGLRNSSDDSRQRQRASLRAALMDPFPAVLWGFTCGAVNAGVSQSNTSSSTIPLSQINICDPLIFNLTQPREQKNKSHSQRLCWNLSSGRSAPFTQAWRFSPQQINLCLPERNFTLPANCYQHVCGHYKSACVDS